MKRLIPSLSLLLILSFSSIAQVITPGGIYQRYEHLLYLKNDNLVETNRSIHYFTDTLSWNKWKFAFPELSDTKHSFKFFDPELNFYYNTQRPYGTDDGSLWRGKGLTTSFNFGFIGHLGILHFAFVPSVFYSQNSHFKLAPQIQNNISKYNYQFIHLDRIDFVQKYGKASFTRFSLGQTELRLIWKKATIAASTANFRIGPSRQNPILMSANAEGFPHLEIGTIQPVQLKIKSVELGRLYANLYYGILNESKYYDEDPENNQRYFTALSITYQIPYFENLRIGLNRVFYEDLQNFQGIKDLTRTFLYYSDRDGIPVNGIVLNDYFDQLASFTAEWGFPQIDLRAYLEFAKNDFNGSVRDFWVDLDHARGFTIGLEKAFTTAKDHQVLVNIEHTNISMSKSFLYRPVSTYYEHTVVPQGYTHDGQVIGAGIGPGSVSNYLGITWFGNNSMIEFFGQRVQVDDDYFLKRYGFYQLPDWTNRNLRQSEIRIGGGFLQSRERIAFGVELTWSKRLNLYYQEQNDQTNFYIGLRGKYFIRSHSGN